MVDEDIGFEPFKPETEKTAKGGAVPSYSSDSIQIGRRIKVMEEAVNNLRRKILVNEQNDLNRNKKILTEQKATLDDINELKKEIENIKRVMMEIISELKACARKEEVDVLKKYIDVWNPIRFVTEETVERMIDEKMGKE